MTSPNVDAPWTVARLLAWTKDYLQRHGLESPRLCAELLLAHAMGCERLRLFTQYEHTPDVATLDQFRAMVREAATGRPIAYIVGRKDFFSLSFEVTPDVLIPRPETELLVERAVRWVREHPQVASPRILDLGSGSGCIALSLARHLPQAQLFASDLSAPALEVARRNAEKLGLAERVDFQLGDLFEPWHAGGEGSVFDLIVSNPPYLRPGDTVTVAAAVREHEPHTALFGGDDGLAIIRKLVNQGHAHLAAGGSMFVEIGAGQADAVAALLRQAGWQDIQFFRDGGGVERVVHGRTTAGAVAAVA